MNTITEYNELVLTLMYYSIYLRHFRRVTGTGRVMVARNNCELEKYSRFRDKK